MSKTINSSSQIHKHHQKAQIMSLACALHCIVTPLLIVGAPLMGSMMHNPIIEITLLLVSILCGVLVIHNGYCKHKKRHTILLFAIGVSLWILHSVVDHIGVGGLELYFLIAGTSFVIGSYYFNHRLLKCCPKH